MRLLCLWVGVGVVVVCGGCWVGEIAEVRDFFFTATALRRIRDKKDFHVVLTLEDSEYPEVSFNISLRSLGDEGMDLASEEVTLGVNELRRVGLKVSDLTWESAELVVKATPLEFPQLSQTVKLFMRKLNSEPEVFLQTDKAEYDIGDIVNYRVVVVDGNVETAPKFTQVTANRHFWTSEETRQPWVEVPESGIMRGNFTFNYQTSIRVGVTSNVTSTLHMTTTPPHKIYERNTVVRTLGMMSVKMEIQNRDVYFAQPRLKGRMTLVSSEGLPLEATCNVTIEPDWLWGWGEVRTNFTRNQAHLNLNGLGENFDFDVVEELGAVREGAAEKMPLKVEAECTHLLSGNVEYATETVYLWRSLHKVVLFRTPQLIRKGNSSHPQMTVVLRFFIERRDGGSVEEEDPSKGLFVELLLSNDFYNKMRPSASSFSLPIAEDGFSSLEFGVNEAPPYPWGVSVRMEVGDTVNFTNLQENVTCNSPSLFLSLANKTKSIRKGEVVRLKVRSCVPYTSVNLVLFSSSAIYSSERFAFSPEEGGLDEVIEVLVPHNVTEYLLNFVVYGLCTKQHTSTCEEGYSASVKVNVVSSGRPQEIRAVSQVDVDMSTIVSFQLEGLLPNSVVTLQAAKSLNNWQNRGILIRNDSPGEVTPEDVEVTGNFQIQPKSSSSRSSSLIFIDVERKTSTGDNGSILVTKTFDRVTEFGTYVVSGAIFNFKSGRKPFSNSLVLTVLPPPLTLSVSVPPSVLIGETLEVLGYVQNNLDTPLKAHVTLEWSEGESAEVRDKLVEVKPNSCQVLSFHVAPQQVGDLSVSLKSNISSRLTATKRVKVSPALEVFKVAKFMLDNERRASVNWTSSLETMLTLPANCFPSGIAAKVIFEGDILGDISFFVHEDVFKIASHGHGVSLFPLKILSSLRNFYDARNDKVALKKIVDLLENLRLYSSIPHGSPSVADLCNELLVGVTSYSLPLQLLRYGTKLVERWRQLKSLQLVDGSFQLTPTSHKVSSSEEASDNEWEKRTKRRSMKTESFNEIGVVIDTAVALTTILKVRSYDTYREIFNFPPADFKQGVDFLRRLISGGYVMDNYPLSLVAYLFSHWEGPDAPKFFEMLESAALKDSHGMFWTTKWNGRNLATVETSSVAATSLALMTYVNFQKLENATEIARWLVSKKNLNGFYGTFEETAAAVESLSVYAKFYGSVNGEWPSLLKITQECVTTRRNTSMGDDFTVFTTLKKDGGILKLKICTKKDKLRRLMVMEVSLPSGYKIEESRNFIGNEGLIFLPNPTECKYISLYRMHRVVGENVLTGSVTYYDFSDPLIRSVIYFHFKQR